MSFNPAIFTGNISWVSDVDTVTITRRGGSPGAFTLTTVYSGAADLQEGGGTTYINPAGAVEEAAAVLFIDATSLPAVEVGDTVTRGSDAKTFIVQSTSYCPFVFPHLECKLKRGPLDQRQK